MKFNWFAAALAGFGVIFTKIGVFAAWCAALIGLAIVVGMVATPLASSAGSVAALVLPFVALGVISGVIGAAVHRAVLYPDGADYAYLGFGGAELRIGLLNTALYLLLVILVTASSSLISFTGASSIGGSTVSPALGLPIFVGLLLLGVLLTGLISLVGPAMVDRGWSGIGVGVALAKGQRWKLMAMTMVVCLVAITLAVGLSLAVGFTRSGWMALLGVPIGLALFVILNAPGAAAYKALKGAPPPVEVFD